MTFKTGTEDYTICNFISEPMSITKWAYRILDNTLKEQEKEELTKKFLFSNTELIPVIDNSKSVLVEVDTKKTLNINLNLKVEELERLDTLLKQHMGDFAWEYIDMRGIPSALCTHHIYIKNHSNPVRQP